MLIYTDYGGVQLPETIYKAAEIFLEIRKNLVTSNNGPANDYGEKNCQNI